VSEAVPLRVVDVEALSGDYRTLLRPDTTAIGAGGLEFPRPRYFYEIDSWETARRVQLAAHFALWEFAEVDVREAPLLRAFPRYIPCAVSVLAVHLELFRREVGLPVRIAANGAYRSPAHKASDSASPHVWGTAANIYSIGGEILNEREPIERFAAIAKRVLPAAWCRPYGPQRGQTIDHLHIDLGYIVCAPRA
jgi:hypothetical protein